MSDTKKVRLEYSTVVAIHDDRRESHVLTEFYDCLPQLFEPSDEIAHVVQPVLEVSKLTAEE
jgi:hypothetical protein